MNKEENRIYIRRQFIQELEEKGLNNEESFMIAYYDGPIVPKGHPNYNKNIKVDLDIRKSGDYIYSTACYDGIQYYLNSEIVDKLYTYVEKNINTLVKLNNNQGIDNIDGGGGPLRIKYKSEMIYLKEKIAPLVDKAIIMKIHHDIKRIILDSNPEVIDKEGE